MDFKRVKLIDFPYFGVIVALWGTWGAEVEFSKLFMHLLRNPYSFSYNIPGFRLFSQDFRPKCTRFIYPNYRQNLSQHHAMRSNQINCKTNKQIAINRRNNKRTDSAKNFSFSLFFSSFFEEQQHLFDFNETLSCL